LKIFEWRAEFFQLYYLKKELTITQKYTNMLSGNAFKCVFKALNCRISMGPPAPWTPGQGFVLDPMGALWPSGPQLEKITLLILIEP